VTSKSAHQITLDKLDDVRRERDELRAEIAELNRVYAIEKQLRQADLAEVGRLRAENQWLKTALQRKTEELETAMSEIVRLRANESPQ